ncbi:MAG: 4Fe-4S dicluster domain-containing protein [Candidatus Coatesbacteria bacterium]|nr:4Fe-4S dicluster domain-containing protein [Candidatus Coatesbacteria bacterium]
MRELVVISGKGGTGKTSIVASFAALAQNKVLADCDVDAADLHLVLDPKILSRDIFVGGRDTRILPGHCTACGKCEEICRFDAIFFDGPGNGKVEKTFRIDPIACEGCGVCAYFCVEKAIESKDAQNGEWYISETRHGPMVHAKLFAAQENSGKLVSLVRSEAKRVAKEQGLGLLIVDGSPGIGCPVIASVTGADFVLIVTEPTLSGKHDMERVLELTRHFDVGAAVCVNKFDLNPEMTEMIEASAERAGAKPLGRIRYDSAVTRAQVAGKSVVEFESGGVARDIETLWGAVSRELS